ncbi:phage tail fiber protein [Buttiauxella brennerae ATCC 51605]|uniref:Phage tail fiber protein n=1 Tax=Buttiauxella brennerae ATCC 51605 TaxID=1354251 RepID=A0A1B7IQU1_9ENTR|nr:phage tail fiber protein [Buttiauxella brennerae ATCC 51605]
MAKFKTIITTAGAAKIAAVLAGTGSIVLDSHARMAVGDGNGTLPTPVPSQTALVHEVHRAALNSASIDARDPKNIIAELVIPPETGGFWMREMALYDAAGTLLAVGNMAETYKPSLTEGAGRKQVIRMVIAVSDVSAVTISIDSSTVMATKEYVDESIDKHEKSRKHPDATLTEKGFTQLNSATDSASETLAATPKAVKTVMDLTKTKAPVDSPVLTGTPKAPTPAAGTNTEQLATTAFVRAAVTALINSSPGVLDTLGEIAAALGNDANFAATMTAKLARKIDGDTCFAAGFVGGAVDLPYMRHATSDTAIGLPTESSVSTRFALKAPLASPALTGTPTAPTAAQTVNSTQIATTAFVKAALSALVNSSPAALDTLKELADALGNDANFATTMTDALARKINADTCRTAGFVGGDALLPYFRHTVTDAIINLATKQALNEGLALKAGTDGCELVGFFGDDEGRPYVRRKSSGTNIILATADSVTQRLEQKANLASPALTGTPTAPTAAQTVNSTQIATTAFVKAALSALVNSSPAALDTLKELADALGNDANFATTMTNALANKIDGDTCGAAGFVGGAAGSPYLRHKTTDTVITIATTAAMNNGLALKPGTDGCELVGFFGGDKGRPYVKQKSSGENIVLATAENLTNRLAEKMDTSGFAGTLGPTTGNQQLGAGKLIVQYGEFSIGAAAGSNTTVTFNRAFPNACVAVIPTPGSGGSSEQLGASGKNKTQATITKGIGDVNARAGFYVALGY